MTLLAIIIAAAAAAETGDLIPGKVIVALFSAIFAAGGGIWIGRKGGESAAEKTWADKEQKIRAEIASELRTKIVNDPMSIEQSSYQAAMKANEHDHENLFGHVAKLESKVEGIGAKVDAKFEAINEQLRETKEMVSKLFERIRKGKK